MEKIRKTKLLLIIITGKINNKKINACKCDFNMKCPKKPCEKENRGICHLCASSGDSLSRPGWSTRTRFSFLIGSQFKFTKNYIRNMSVCEWDRY